MKKFTLFLTFLVLCFSFNSQAKPVDKNTAKDLGIKFLQNRTHLRTDNVQLVYTETIADGLPCFYVFATGKSGFVIVSADDRMRPILGYSTESSFIADYIDTGLNTFFEIYKAGLSYAVENNIERDEDAIKDWESVAKTGRLVTGDKGRDVNPLVTTTWNQSDLYNSACPEDTNGYGDHVKSGCVANAMCQLMNYWKWPNSGTGSHSYYCNGYGSTSYGTLTANFADTEYQFELMPKFLDYTSPQTEIDAVALLEFHAGVSVEMMYGATASGAYSQDVPDALVDHFRYSNDIDFKYRDDYSTSAWCNLLRENLDNGMPLYYSGSGESGHAFICDGYQPNNFFHFNWGWQGFDNGFYSIDGMYLTYHYYTYYHNAIFNIHPNPEYYEQPKSVKNVTINTNDATLTNVIEFDAPTQTIGGQDLTDITSIEVLRNDVLIYSFEAPQPGEHLTYTDQLDVNGVNYYFIYPLANNGKGKAVIDTVMTGSTCEMVFDLHDSDGDGWLSPSISVLDSEGKVVKRVGLTEGSEATLIVDVPNKDSLTFYWNYCNVAYSDEDDECSFEIYNHENTLVYASSGKPVVGPFAEYYSSCLPCLSPDYINGEYVYNNETMGALISWNFTEPDENLVFVNLYRSDNENGEYELIAEVNPDDTSYFDEIDIGTYYYKVTALYSTEGDTCESQAAPNQENPSIDYVQIIVTDIIENQDIAFSIYPNPVNNKYVIIQGTDIKNIKIFNVIGQPVYAKEVTTENSSVSIYVDNLLEGIYFVSVTDNNNNNFTKKLIIK